MDRCVDVAHLSHQGLVHMESARGINNQYIENTTFRSVHSRAGYVRWWVRRAGGEVLSPHLLGQSFELQHSGGSAYVGAHQEDALLFALNEPTRQLGCGSGLTGSLETSKQHDDRRLRAQVDAGAGTAHELDELLVNDADEHQTRRKAGRDLGAQCLGLDGLYKGLNDRKRYVRLEQGDAHFAHGLPDVVFGDSTPAPQVFDGLGEASGQIVEHEVTGAVNVDSGRRL